MAELVYPIGVPAPLGIQSAGAWAVYAGAARPLPSPRTLRTGFFGADTAGRVADKVVIKGTPETGVSRRVGLLDAATLQLVATTWSDASGDYEFLWLDMARTYIPVSIDHLGLYKSEAAGPVAPVRMPGY